MGIRHFLLKYKGRSACGNEKEDLVGEMNYGNRKGKRRRQTKHTR